MRLSWQPLQFLNRVRTAERIRTLVEVSYDPGVTGHLGHRAAVMPDGGAQRGMDRVELSPESSFLMEISLFLIAAALMVVGVCGAIVPALPGIPLLFCGIWLAAYADAYRHLGGGWLLAIALVGVIGMVLDLVSGALGAKRVGASSRAVWGALLGTLVGLLFGLPGLLLGPFLGAVAGELSASSSVERAARVGVNAWIGFLLGTVAKLVASVSMVGMAAAAWWWNRA